VTRPARPARPARDVAGPADVVALAEPVRRAVRARLAGRPELDSDDVVQETLTRVWAARWRLERATLCRYAVAVARNLVVSAEREADVERRHGPRLAEPAGDGDPLAGVLAAEEQADLARALSALRDGDRRLLVEHELRGVEARQIAASQGVPPGTIAARLARARARLRVEHLLAARGVRLPSARCRGVLDAVSLGDRCRQRALLATEHLADCPTRAGVAEALTTRRSPRGPPHGG
jgi:RNA polymerase sigma factor (sigma-70 family)